YNMSALFGWNMNNRSTIFTSIGAARGSFDIHNVILGFARDNNDPISTNVKLDGIRFGIGYQTKIRKGLSLRLEWGQTDYEETPYKDDISRFAAFCNDGNLTSLGSVRISADEAECGDSGTTKGIPLIKSIDDILDITENHFSVNLVYQFGSGLSKDDGELLATGAYVLGSIGYQAGSYIYDAVLLQGGAISSLIADNEELEIQGSSFSVGVGYNRIFARDLYLGTFLSYRQTDTNSKYYRGLNTDLEMQEEVTLEGQIGRVISDSTRAYLALGISRAGFRTTTSIANGKQPNGGAGAGPSGSTLEPLETPADRQDLGPMIAIGVDTALSDKLFLNARLSYNRYEQIPFFTHRLPGTSSSLPHQRYDAKDISNYRFSIGIGYYF
ncbi:MAG: outer membrane beta-barrel protein, partial [Parvibaculales bacterium]